eukprot:102930-Chlamydomonas_euryale.AAC.3
MHLRRAAASVDGSIAHVRIRGKAGTEAGGDSALSSLNSPTPPTSAQSASGAAVRRPTLRIAREDAGHVLPPSVCGPASFCPPRPRGPKGSPRAARPPPARHRYRRTVSLQRRRMYLKKLLFIFGAEGEGWGGDRREWVENRGRG